MRISHTNVTEVLHVLEVSSSSVANKMKCVFVKFTTDCLQVKSTWWQFTMKFILKFTIEVYSECLIYDEVLTQSYIREKLLQSTLYICTTYKCTPSLYASLSLVPSWELVLIAHFLFTPCNDFWIPSIFKISIYMHARDF